MTDTQSQTQSLKKILYPWLIWVLAASFFFYKYFVQVSPSVMNTQLMSAFSLTGAGLGNLAACFFYAYFLMQIPAGLILDRFSPRKVLFITAACCAVGLYLFAHSFSLTSAALSRFLVGICAAFAPIACFKLVTLWFSPKRFAFMAGLSMTVAMLGAIFGQAPLSYLVSVLDWRASLEFIAAIGIVLSFLILFIIPDHSDALHHAPHERSNVWSELLIVMKHKETWLLSIFSGLAFSPLSVFAGLWGVAYLERAFGLSAINAAGATSLIFIGFAIGAPLSGWLSDYFQRRKPLMWIGVSAACASLSAILHLPLSLQALYIALFIFGLGSSCFFICFSMIRENHHIMIAGTVLGFMNSFDSICEAVTEPLVGKFLDLSWKGEMQNGIRLFSVDDYRFGLTSIVIYLISSLVILFFIKETYCQTIDSAQTNETM